MSPVLVDLFFIKIYWYSVIVLLAFLIGGFVLLKETRKKYIEDDLVINFIFFLVPISLLGARLYYVIFNWEKYQNNLIESLYIWEGGLAIHGGIIFGLLWIIFYTRSNDIKTMRFVDMVAPALLLGQAIGRWGNFFNKEVYGLETTAAELQSLYIPEFIIDGMFIRGTYYQPLFLYESLWCLLGFVVLIIIRSKSRYLKIGHLTSLALIWYGTGRYVFEGMRTSTYNLMAGDFMVSQIVAILMVIIGVFMYFYLRKGSRFDNLYAEEDKTPTRVERLLDEEIIDEGPNNEAN